MSKLAPILLEFLQRRDGLCDRCTGRLCHCAIPPPLMVEALRPTLSELVLAVLAAECMPVDDRLNCYVLRLQSVYCRWVAAARSLRVAVPLNAKNAAVSVQHRIAVTLLDEAKRFGYTVLPNMLRFTRESRVLYVDCLASVFNQ